MSFESQKSKVCALLKRKEHDFNKGISVSEDLNYYTATTVVYVATKNTKKATVICDKKKAQAVEKKYFTNKDKQSLRCLDQTFYPISADIIGVSYHLYYFDHMKPEVYQLLQKLSFKDVDMDVMIEELYKNGYDVNDILTTLLKYSKEMDKLAPYFEKIDTTKLFSIVNKHGVTMKKLCEHPYIHELIKQSPYTSYFLSFRDTKANAHVAASTVKVSDKKLSAMIHCYAIFHFKHDDFSLLSINWQRVL